MNTLQIWATIAGGLMPPVVAFIEQPKWPTWFRTTAMMAISVVLGIIIIYIQEGTLDISAENWFTTITLIVAAAQVAYHKFWKTSTIAPILELKSSKNKTGGTP